MNETILKLGGVEVRVLDENKNMGMFASAKVGGQSVDINLFVDDIKTFFNNAVFSDKFNHLWVVNQKC